MSILQAPANQDEISSDGSGDASASGEAGDAVTANGTREGAVEGGMYYMGGMNAYPPHGYIYNYPQGGKFDFVPSCSCKMPSISEFNYSLLELPAVAYK